MSSLRIALVYNQKKEEPTLQSERYDSLEPQRANGDIADTLVLRPPPRLQSSPSTDIYAEWDTFETIDAVRAALAEIHDVTLIEADTDAYEKLRLLRPDIVFNISEGLHGVSREAQMPAIFDLLQIPYSGSDPVSLAICLDKSRTKEILSYYKIATPAFWSVSKLSDLDGVQPAFPCMVKPLHEGSSKGIYNSSMVADRSELRTQVAKILDEYSQPAIVEEYLPGREFTVAMLGNGENVNVLPIVEIKFDSLPAGVNPIYSYEAKWIWDRSDAPLEIFECPAHLTDGLRSEIETVCRHAYRVLRCRDWSRIDVRLDAAGKPHIIEVNPLPGILPNPEDNSCFPKAARVAGLSYQQLMQSVLALAAQRFGLTEPALSPLHSS